VPLGPATLAVGWWRVDHSRYPARMIDFQSGGVLSRLGPSDPKQIAAELAPILVDGEVVHLSFKGMRDSVVFTNKRLITVNVQGLTGKKRDYSSLPYSKIQAWSIETAGQFDLDAELELWFSGLGKVRLDFKGQVGIRTIGHLIGKHVL
jgi:PH (Pleckstrin Homology) domain-containing protein